MRQSAMGKLIFSMVIILSMFMAGCGGGSSSSSGANDDFTVNLTIVPDRLNVEAGGDAVVRVFVYDADGQPAADKTVTLSATLGTLAATTVTTGEDGTITTTLTPSDSTTLGTSTVTATLGTVSVWVDVEFYKTLG
jgi:adhesin/invasin